MSASKVFSIRLDENLMKSLAAEGRLSGGSASQVIRERIERFVAAEVGRPDPFLNDRRQAMRRAVDMADDALARHVEWMSQHSKTINHYESRRNFDDEMAIFAKELSLRAAKKAGERPEKTVGDLLDEVAKRKFERQASAAVAG